MTDQMRLNMIGSSSSPLKWKRPDEVMRNHLRKKKQALQARMCGVDKPSAVQDSFVPNFNQRDGVAKKKNPFRCQLSKRLKEDENAGVISSELDSSCDNTLFQLLTANTFPEGNGGHLQTSFTSILSKLGQEDGVYSIDEKKPLGRNYIPVDWTLKTKIRFMSPKPFPWNLKLKTCEEASGITGYVRCINSCLSPDKRSSCSLDTSPNARFHQCCLVWQYPSFPWLTLFPRTAGRISSTATSLIAADPQVRDCLHKEWAENFRSLFQLVRALQCPFFYVCANNFTCLFRATGIGGLNDIHALLTPTTRGFRQLLKEEDVVFSMPLKKARNPLKRLSSESNSDTGYDTLDSFNDEQSLSNTSLSVDKDMKERVDDRDVDDDENEDEWLQSMGVAEDEIRRLNNQQAKVTFNKEREVDKSPESLVYVEGVEAQALFNFLLNCKSTIASTGPLAGVPPTLLAPVAFRGATLKPLTVRQSIVKVESESFHSIEIRGPILPHTIHNLCGLMCQSQEEFSATFANVESTRPFSLAVNLSESVTESKGARDTEASPVKQGTAIPSAHTPTKTPVLNALTTENLSDCGLHSSLINTFCSPDTSRTQAVDSLKFNSDGTYTWS